MKLSLSVLLAAMFALLTQADHAQAQTPMPPPLFTSAETATAPSSVQQRVAHLSQGQRTGKARLVQATPLKNELRTTSQLSLNLSPDLTLTASATRTERTRGGRGVWTADVYSGARGLSDKPIGEATFVDGDLGLTGSVSTPDRLIQVYPLGDGYHMVIERRWDEMPLDHPEDAHDEMPDSTSHDTPAPCDPEDVYCGEPGGGGGGGGGNPPSDHTVRVLVAYTQAVANEVADVEGLAALAEFETNDSFARSGVTNLSVEIADVVQINFVEEAENLSTPRANLYADRDALTNTSDGRGDEVHGLRDTELADVVVLLTSQYAYSGYCGVARGIGVSANNAFVVVNHDCATGYYSFGHEIGHLFGARHDIDTDGTLTPYGYGHGYRRPGEWRTIMAYSSTYQGGPGEQRIRNWSNPSKTYGGHAMGTTDRANNARVLRERASTVAAFRTAPAPPTLSAGISGPSTLNTGETEQWFASATGGTSPYSFAWRKGPDASSLGPVEGTASFFFATLTQDTYIEVTVTDVNNDEAVAGMFVDVWVPDCDPKRGCTSDGDDVAADAGTSSEARNHDALPATFGLESVAPNPSRSTATVHFGLDNEASTQLVVYDVLGREVARLVDGFLEAGQYTATLDTARLPAGVYICRLQAGAQTASLRLTVVE